MLGVDHDWYGAGRISPWLVTRFIWLLSFQLHQITNSKREKNTNLPFFFWENNNEGIKSPFFYLLYTFKRFVQFFHKIDIIFIHKVYKNFSLIKQKHKFKRDKICGNEIK